MKRLILSILILVNSICIPAYACGPYYPYGDEVRFNLLNPRSFNLNDYSLFNYTANIYSYNYDNDDYQINADGYKSGLQANLLLWQKRCQGKPSLDDIHEAVYTKDQITADIKDENSFIQYLSVNKDIEAIKYLNFAKQCEPFNSILDDPWERREVVKIPKREQLIKQAESEIKRLKDEDLKCRYAFLAIRLAYYNGDSEIIQRLYKAVYEKSKTQNIVYYWSTYFYCLTLEDDTYKNYLLAQVFVNAPDKRFVVCQNTDRKIPIEDVLEKAANAQEKSWIELLYAVRNPAKGLDVLQKIYTQSPNFDGLDFLLLREVSKLEDWICTPYYTELGPALHYGEYSFGWNDDPSKDNANIMLQRIEEDRKYARQVMDFINKADFKKVHDPALWQTAKVYLLFMAGDYASVLNEIHSPYLKTLNPEGLAFIAKLEALTLTANQKPNEAVILPSVKTALMKYDTDSRFIFAVGRELEFKNNTTDAALLYSKKNKKGEEYPDWDWDNGIYWRTKLRHCTLYADFYTGYFFYMDAQYTPEQVEKLISDIKANASKQDAFSKWKYGRITSKIDRLYDLLGTKYMRQDELNNALQAFKAVNDTLWNSSVYPYKEYLAANPFYTNFYNEHSKTAADTVSYNKYELVAKILEYLKKAENPQNPDRDYYYFLVGNAYFNMTQYGNSWLMKRYYWTGNATPTLLEDDDDYFGCLHAQKYYQKAHETAKNKKFAALCLRMAGRCEKYNIAYQYSLTLSTNDYSEKEINRRLNKNKYYKQLAREYPDDYDDLISNCESFTAYFQARK